MLHPDNAVSQHSPPCLRIVPDARGSVDPRGDQTQPVDQVISREPSYLPIWSFTTAPYVCG